MLVSALRDQTRLFRDGTKHLLPMGDEAKKKQYATVLELKPQ